MDIKVNKGSIGVNTQEAVEDDQIDLAYAQLAELHNILKEADPVNSPSLSTLETWKDYHGEVYVSTVIDPNKYYIFRTLKRFEYKKLRAQGTLTDSSAAYEIIVEQCLLYPQPTQEFRLKSNAGLIETLGKQINYQSGFVSDQEALSFIRVI